MTQPTDFPREDLGEDEQFKITSGNVKIDDSAELAFYGGRHNYIRAADQHPGSTRLPVFVCLLCQIWCVTDKDDHIRKRCLGKSTTRAS